VAVTEDIADHRVADPYRWMVGSTRDQSYAEIADVWSFLLAVSGDPDFAAR
jgi:hypothetical protein